MSYTLEDIFEKKLYALIPYYLLKYEKKKESLEGSDNVSILLDLVNDIADEVEALRREIAGLKSTIAMLRKDKQELIKGFFMIMTAFIEIIMPHLISTSYQISVSKQTKETHNDLRRKLSVLLSGNEIGKDEKDAVMVALNGAYWR